MCSLAESDVGDVDGDRDRVQDRGAVGVPDVDPAAGRDHERVAELIAAVAEVIAEEAGPALYRRASERPVAPVSTLAGTRVPARPCPSTSGRCAVPSAFPAPAASAPLKAL